MFSPLHCKANKHYCEIIIESWKYINAFIGLSTTRSLFHEMSVQERSTEEGEGNSLLPCCVLASKRTLLPIFTGSPSGAIVFFVYSCRSICRTVHAFRSSVIVVGMW